MSELSELFERNPFKYTDQDLDAIVARMRQAQAQHELGVPAKVAERVKKPKASEKLLNDLGLTGPMDMLKDLGLE
jgi:hypothetical protein